MALEVGTIGSFKENQQYLSSQTQSTGSRSEVKVGIKFPFSNSDDASTGYFESTYTSAEATRENIKMLLNTNKGERVFQPDLGLDLRQFLFNPIDDDMKQMMSDEIENSISTWLPFVNPTAIEILYDDISYSLLKINIKFIINNDPTNLNSVEIIVQ